MTRNALAEGVKVIYCNGYDLARRHTPFCRVELRHRRDLSQLNILTLDKSSVRMSQSNNALAS